jgi:uncharacterized protein (DUF934 family)
VAESGNPIPQAANEANYLRFRDDAPADEPAVSLDSFFEQPNAVSVRIEAGDDPERLIPHLARVKLVEVDFPKFRDGRGFSTARILREAGYTGEIKATGDVLVDLVFFMRRCGFDSFAPDVAIDPEVLESCLDRYPHVYQHAADPPGSSSAVPIWQLRHPELARG